MSNIYNNVLNLLQITFVASHKWQVISRSVHQSCACTITMQPAVNHSLYNWNLFVNIGINFIYFVIIWAHLVLTCVNSATNMSYLAINVDKSVQKYVTHPCPRGRIMELDQYLENMIFNTNVIWILWAIYVVKEAEGGPIYRMKMIWHHHVRYTGGLFFIIDGVTMNHRGLQSLRSTSLRSASSPLHVDDAGACVRMHVREAGFLLF